MLSGVRAEIALKIYGEDLDTLRTLAEGLRERLSARRGPRRPAGREAGAHPAAPHRRRLPAGRPLRPDAGDGDAGAGDHVERAHGLADRRGQPPLRRGDAPVRPGPLDDRARRPPDRHAHRARAAAHGGDVEETDGPNQILRENGQRRIAVFGNTDGRRDMAAIVADIRRIVGETPFPQGYVTRFEGTFQAQEEATLRIGALSLLSLAMIFVVLYSRYQSTALALIIMGNIPLALIGSVIALNIAGQPLSVASMIGFITLAGISARNGILKITHYINLALYEGERFGRDLVVRGSLERLTPVLMTALSAGLALTPLLIGADLPGREILHPVAVTIFGGLISATLLDTFLTPVLFLTFGRKPLERIQASRAGALTPAEAF